MGRLGRRQFLAGLGSVGAWGREKGSLIPGADAIVCGRIERIWRLPWFDGWHLWGTLHVTQVVKGPVSVGAALPWQYVCGKCGTADVLPIHSDIYSLSIWYLRRDRNNNWTSAEGPDDLGWRPIRDLPELLEVIRKYGDK